MRIVIVSSTAGSVLNELLKISYFKSHIHSVVSDRVCPAIAKADSQGIKTNIISHNDKAMFCDDLLIYLRNNNIEYVISFYTKLFVGRILIDYKNRIINLHPSLLPSFKGLNGFDDSLNHDTKYIGSTIHFIDESMDEGKIILQTVYPKKPGTPAKNLRHIIFQHQCKSLLQVVKWLDESRITIQGNSVIVQGAEYVDYEYSPNIDFDQAKKLEIPLSDVI